MMLTVLALSSVGATVFRVAGFVLVILVFGLLAASVRYFAKAIPRADAIVVEAMLGLDRASAVAFYDIYRRSRPANIGVAWFLAVLFGPVVAFFYLRDWRRSALALITFNGLGLWSIESWFSVPQLVILQNARKAAAALELVTAQNAERIRKTAP